MAGFSDLIHDVVQVADDITDSLQMIVMHAAVTRTSPLGPIAYNAQGETTWGTAVPRGAIVEKKQTLKLAADGTEKLSHMKMTILDTGVLVDLLDLFTNVNGEVYPPIMAIENLLDSAGLPYMNEVWF